MGGGTKERRKFNPVGILSLSGYDVTAVGSARVITVLTIRIDNSSDISRYLESKMAATHSKEINNRKPTNRHRIAGYFGYF